MSSQRLALFGMYFEMVFERLITLRTVERAIFDELKISSPASWRDRFTDVFITLRAFLDVISAITIIAPAMMRK